MLDLLRRNRDIRLLFTATVVSYLGDWFTFVALTGLVDERTGSTVLVSLVLVVQTLPGFFVSPVAGAVADRFDRRKVLMTVSVGQCAAALGMLLAVDGPIWIAFACQIVVTALAAFVMPASGAAVPNLVDNDDDLRVANSLMGSTWGVMLALGAGIGGVFTQVFGRSAAFLADAVTFAVAGLCVAMIRRAMQSHATNSGRQKIRPIADTAEAVHLARRDPVILALMASKMTFAVGAGLVSMLPLLASSAYGAGDSGRGMLIAMRGLGTAVGPYLGTRLVRNNLGRILTVCGLSGLTFSVLYLGAVASPHIALAGLFIAGAHVGGGAQWTLSTYGLQLESPDELRGRVLAGDFALVTLVLASTSLLAGVTAEAIGVRSTMAVFAGVAGAAGSTYLLVTRSLRRRLRSEQPRR